MTFKEWFEKTYGIAFVADVDAMRIAQAAWDTAYRQGYDDGHSDGHNEGWFSGLDFNK